MDDQINKRLDNFERSIGVLTEQVSRVVTMFERLIILEERNHTQGQLLNQFRDDFYKDLQEIKSTTSDKIKAHEILTAAYLAEARADRKELRDKVEHVNNTTIRLVAGITVAGAFFSTIVPIVLKMVKLA